MNKWKKINSEIIFVSKWIKLTNNSYDIGDGIIRKDYYNIERSDYAIIIAETREGKIVMIRQYRRGAEDFFFEFPAGMIDKNENPIEAGERELTEETGYFGKGQLLGKLVAQPVFSKMKAHIIKVKIDGWKQIENPSDDEILEVHKFSVSEIKTMICEGKINCMGTVAAFNLNLAKN